MQPYPWWTLYLEPPLLCQIWDSPPDYLIQMRQLVSIHNSIFKSIRKLIFPAFGTILVLGGSQFPFKILLKKYSKIDFSSFWHDLGFGGSFFPFKIQFKKELKNCFFPAFGTILVLVAGFFVQKTAKNAKKYKKDTSSYIF